MAIQQRDGSSATGQRAPLAEGVVVVCEEPGFVIATWKNVSIVVWGTQATMARAQKIDTFSQGMSAEHRQGFSAVHVVANGARLPDSATRAELDRLTSKYSKNLACFGTVIEGTGFWASAMQSFVTSLHWVSRRPFKVRISSTLSEIAGWMPLPHREKTGVQIAETDVLRAMTSVRERI